MSPPLPQFPLHLPLLRQFRSVDGPVAHVPLGLRTALAVLGIGLRVVARRAPLAVPAAVVLATTAAGCTDHISHLDGTAAAAAGAGVLGSEGPHGCTSLPYCSFSME